MYRLWITKNFQMSILVKTNKFHHEGTPCSGGAGAIAPVAPPLNPALVTKDKNRYSESYYNVLYAGPKSARNILTNLSPNPAQNRTRPEEPNPTYKSALAYTSKAWFTENCWCYFRNWWGHCPLATRLPGASRPPSLSVSYATGHMQSISFLKRIHQKRQGWSYQQRCRFGMNSHSPKTTNEPEVKIFLWRHEGQIFWYAPVTKTWKKLSDYCSSFVRLYGAPFIKKLYRKDLAQKLLNLHTFSQIGQM